METGVIVKFVGVVAVGVMLNFGLLSESWAIMAVGALAVVPSNMTLKRGV